MHEQNLVTHVLMSRRYFILCVESTGVQTNSTRNIFVILASTTTALNFCQILVRQAREVQKLKEKKKNYTFFKSVLFEILQCLDAMIIKYSSHVYFPSCKKGLLFFLDLVGCPK